MERGLLMDAICVELGRPGFESWLSGVGMILEAFLSILALPFLLA